MARIDDLAQRLAEDHVIVEPVASNGHHADYVEVLSDDVDAAPFPMYVAVVGRIPGDELPPEPGQVAQSLHRRIGEDGVYIVAVDSTTEIIAPGVEEIWSIAVSNARYDAARALDGRTTAAADAHVLAALAPEVGRGDDVQLVQDAVADIVAEVESEPMFLRREFDLTDIDFGSAPNPGDPDVVSALTVGIGLLVALAVGRVLSWRVAVAARPERRRVATSRSAVSTSGPLRQAVTPVLDAARQRLDTIGTVPDTDGDDRLAALVAANWPRIEHRAEAARALLDTDDMADAVAARFLADQAATAARRVRAGKEPEWRRPCYFDPRHDAATDSVELPGAGGVTVPGCRACARRVDEDELPDAVPVRVRNSEVPFYTRADVWAATGFGALRDDVADIVLAGARGGRRLPKELRR